MGEQGDGASSIRIEKSPLQPCASTFHRTHDFRATAPSNFRFTRPQVPARRTGIVKRLVERWQLGGIFSWSSGALDDYGCERRDDLTAVPGTINLARTANTANIRGTSRKRWKSLTPCCNHFDGYTWYPIPSINHHRPADLSSSFSNKGSRMPTVTSFRQSSARDCWNSGRRRLRSDMGFDVNLVGASGLLRRKSSESASIRHVMNNPGGTS